MSRTWAALLLLTPGMYAQPAGDSPGIRVAQAGPSPAAPFLQGGPGPGAYRPSGDTLVARVGADGIIEGFRRASVQDGAPRIAIRVQRAGVRPVTGEAAPSLADEQLFRDIERFVGRTFRHAGATLADIKAVTSATPAQVPSLAGQNAAADRAALATVADVAIEVSVSLPRQGTPSTAESAPPLPGLQATVIRLRDGTVVARASADEVMGSATRAGRAAPRFTLEDLVVRIALALMEDMLAARK